MKFPFLYLLIFIPLVFSSCSSAVKSISNSKTAANSAEFVFGEGFGNQYFYEPRNDYPKTPSSYQLKYFDIYFPSSDGALLHGWFIPAISGSQNAKVTVVYSHGNLGSVGYHINKVHWLPEAGVNVIMYDYRGYGRSSGKITRRGLIDDAHAAFRYAAQRPDLKHTKIVSHGHSLGGAKSIAALGSKGTPPRLVLAINESSFASYKEMAKIKAGKMGSQLVTDAYSPIQLIDDVKVPVIVIHGTNDNVIPIDQGRRLRDAARRGSSLKHYWEVPGGSHYDTLRQNNGALRKKLLTIYSEL